jgi:hypothetical protein
MVAALARCEQLRSQIHELSDRKVAAPAREPRTLAEAVAEQHRLEEILAELSRPISSEDSEEDLAAVLGRRRTMSTKNRRWSSRALLYKRLSVAR